MPAPARPLFDRRTVIVLGLVSSLSFVAALIYSVLGPELRDDWSDGADAFSRSALGHHALVAALEDSGMSVVTSRYASSDKANPNAPLLLAEPRVLHAGAAGDNDVPLVLGLRELVAQALERDAAVILVLPKWRGTADASHPGWIERATTVDSGRAAEVLALALDRPKHTSDVLRFEAPLASYASSLRSELGTAFGSDAVTSPSLPRPQLLARSVGLEPLVWTPEGVLVGRLRGLGKATSAPRGSAGNAGRRGGVLYVIADPDLLNNAGLGRGANAAIFGALVAHELDAHALVVDETLHGFGRPPSLWADLLRWPLVLGTTHVLLVLGLLAWMMVGRFGRTEPLPARVPPGARAIVGATADLLEGGASYGALARYLELRLRRAALASGLPAGMPAAALYERLGAIGKARGARDTPFELDAAVSALGGKVTAKSLALAQRIHRYCQEVSHGHG